MAIYRIFPSADGESHIEQLDPAKNPEFVAFPNVAEAKIQVYPELRKMDFHPLPERRLIIHLMGEVEIGVSDGAKQIFRPGDVRLMEDITGRGHSHRDLSNASQAMIVLKD